jgi:hypothetical protein
MMLLAKLTLVGSLLVAASVQVTLTAPGHAPKIKTRWYYVVRAAAGGKPVAARLTAQIVDPIGGSHPVTFANGPKNITNWPFKGTFRDFIIWPASSRGVPLKLRVTVRAGGVKKVITYAVTPRG